MTSSDTLDLSILCTLPEDLSQGSGSVVFLGGWRCASRLRRRPTPSGWPQRTHIQFTTKTAQAANVQDTYLPPQQAQNPPANGTAREEDVSVQALPEPDAPISALVTALTVTLGRRLPVGQYQGSDFDDALPIAALQSILSQRQILLGQYKCLSNSTRFLKWSTECIRWREQPQSDPDAVSIDQFNPQFPNSRLQSNTQQNQPLPQSQDDNMKNK
ncbi:hypothetical protein EVAR_22408_1 [Eumeta japonica]|uniref:Uncharacterized protein n=1 Tax=Eumeta variegata TaxID=151549 RepID=A0A4C2A3U0_EUMVA|nr:hypothetical protein EVAR_22408_1 [Eumeta japonica]